MTFPGGLTYQEIEHYIESLQLFSPEQTATPSWKKQRKSVELFNIISHRAAEKKSDDFVLSTLVSREKMPVLVHDLLLSEAMRSNVYSHCLAELATTPAGIYLYLEYESIIINLLTCLLYHEEAVTGLGDSVIDLIDYCWRSVTREFLQNPQQFQDEFDPAAASIGGGGGGEDATPESAKEDAKRLAEMPREKLLAIKLRTSQVHRAMNCISILWFIVDRFAAIPLAAQNAILSKHDLLVGFTTLIEVHPWLLYKSSKKIFKFKANQFVPIPAADIPMVVAPEAHSWFVIHYLLCDRDCRNKYQYNRFRKEQILRLKKFLNEIIVDQLPVLADVQRAIEELSFMEPPSGTDEKFKTKMLLIDPISSLQSAIANFSGWKDLVAAFKGSICRDPEIMRADAKLCSDIIDCMELDGEPAPSSATSASASSSSSSSSSATSAAASSGKSSKKLVQEVSSSSCGNPSTAAAITMSK